MERDFSILLVKERKMRSFTQTAMSLEEKEARKTASKFSSQTHYDHLWFSTLEGLKLYYGHEQIDREGLLVARDVARKEFVFKQFAWFQTIENFSRHKAKYPVDGRHFYEIINGPQRVFFDIDGITSNNYPVLLNPALYDAPKEIEEIMRDTTPSKFLMIFIMVAIKNVLQKTYGVEVSIGDFILCESLYLIDSETSLPKKISVHVVAKEHFVNNNLEMKDLCLKVKEEILSMADDGIHDVDLEAVTYASNAVDGKIYSKNRLFRLLGSTKLGSDAVKEPAFNHDWTLEETLVSNRKYMKTLLVPIDL